MVEIPLPCAQTLRLFALWRAVQLNGKVCYSTIKNDIPVIDMSFLKVQHYANYVTGYPFKAILSPSMYDASADNEQVFRPPFAHSRLTANHST